MDEVTAKVEKRDHGDTVVLYKGKEPIGHIIFQEMRKGYGDTNGILRYARNGKRHEVILVGATVKSVIGGAGQTADLILNG